MIQKIHSKMHPISCADYHHDVITIEVEGMIENAKKMNISLTELEFFVK